MFDSNERTVWSFISFVTNWNVISNSSAPVVKLFASHFRVRKNWLLNFFLSWCIITSFPFFMFLANSFLPSMSSAQIPYSRPSTIEHWISAVILPYQLPIHFQAYSSVHRLSMFLLIPIISVPFSVLLLVCSSLPYLSNYFPHSAPL